MRTKTQSETLLRDARRQSGLTQVEFASRAGVAQSVISAYEGGHRQPALSTLVELIEASGLEVQIRLRPLPGGLKRLTGPRGRVVRRLRRQVVDIAAAHGVTNMRVFGSVARGEDRADSDIDLLVDLPTGMGLLGLGRLRDDLESLLGTEVDVVPADGLKPDVAARIQADVVTL
jgi:uncharacterized protein